MKLTISKQDAIDLFSEKYDEDIEDVIFVDEDGNQLVAKNAATPTPAPAVGNDDDDNEQDGNGIDEYLDEDGDHEELDRNFNAEELVQSSGIAKILEKALKDQGYKSRIPANPVEKCEEAAESFLDTLKRRDRRLMQELVSHPNFKRFGLLWQDFQNFIHKKL